MQKISENIRIENVIKRKSDEMFVKWKDMIIHLIVGLIKKISLYKMSYFSEQYTPSKNKIKLELHLSNYATKSALKIKQVLIHQILLKMLI